MPIPRNWAEELTSEWLQLLGYLTEVGVPVGVGTRGGRKEADVIGVKINEENSERELSIYHVETGSLGGNHDNNVERLQAKFSPDRVKEIKARAEKRIGSFRSVKYEKVYVDIWGNPTKIEKFMNDSLIQRESIKVWTVERLFGEIFTTIAKWLPEHKSKQKEGTIPEAFWMLKLLESLREAKLLKF